MNDNDVIDFTNQKLEVINLNDYKYNVHDLFKDIPDAAVAIINKANELLKKIENLLYTAPSFLEAVRATIPKITYQAILSDKQQELLSKGVIKLMTKKDGSLLANLINTKTKKIVATIPLKDIKLTPELCQALQSFTMQLQLSQISEQMRIIQKSVEEVKKGQEIDRLATAYSCQQKLLQSLEIKDKKLRKYALLNLAFDSENSRNLLMQSQKFNLNSLMNQPESYIGKIISGSTQSEINSKMIEIRESLNTLNMVTLVEAIAYQELGEESALKKSFQYYNSFINSVYLKDKQLLEKLDLLDSSSVNYWTNVLPKLTKNIKRISDSKELKSGKGDKNNERKKM